MTNGGKLHLMHKKPRPRGKIAILWTVFVEQLEDYYKQQDRPAPTEDLLDRYRTVFYAGAAAGFKALHVPLRTGAGKRDLMDWSADIEKELEEWTWQSL